MISILKDLNLTSESLKDLNLSSEQCAFIDKRAGDSGLWLWVLTFIIMLSATFLLEFILMDYYPNKIAILPFAVAIPAFCTFLLIGKLYLLQSLLKPANNYQLTLVKKKGVFDFSPYLRKWLLLVSSFALSILVILTLVHTFFNYLHSSANPTLPYIMWYVFLSGAYQRANYSTIVRLLKSGDASIETVRG